MQGYDKSVGVKLFLCDMLKRMIMLSLFVGFAYAKAQNAGNVDFQTKKVGEVTISYPNSYEFTDNMPGGAKFGLLSPLTSDKDTFRDNVNLLIQEIGQDIDVSEGLEPLKQQMSKYITNYVGIDAKIMNLPVGKAIRLEYTGNLGVMKIHWVQYMVSKNKKLYILSCTSEKDTYNQFASEFADIAKSLTLDTI